MQFLLYCLCGGLGVTIDYGIYHLVLTQGIGYQVANVLGYLGGTLVSFSLNRIITFRVKDQVFRRLVIFLGVAAVGYLSSACVLWLLVVVMQIDARIAKLLTLPLVVIIQFSLNRRLTFNEIKSQKPVTA